MLAAIAARASASHGVPSSRPITPRASSRTRASLEVGDPPEPDRLDSPSTASQRHAIATSSRSAASTSTVVVADVRCAIASAIGCGPVAIHTSRVRASNGGTASGAVVPAARWIASPNASAVGQRSAGAFASARMITSRKAAGTLAGSGGGSACWCASPSFARSTR